MKGAANTPSGIYVLLATSAVFWGGTFVAGRLVANDVAPHTLAFLRFAVASVLLLGWTYWRLQRLPALSHRQASGIALLGLSGILTYNLLFFEGLRSVEAGRAALIIAINPVLIALASNWLFGEPLGWRRALGIAISVGGAFVVISRGNLGLLLDQGIGRGELMLLGCVLSWVFYTLVGKRVLRGLTPLVTVTYASVAGTLMLGLFIAVDGGIDTTAFTSPGVWGSVIYLAVFGTVLGFVWFYRGVQAIGAARAAQFINIVPLSGVLLGALILDEPLTLSILAGGGLVLLGLWLTNSRRNPLHPAQSAH